MNTIRKVTRWLERRARIKQTVRELSSLTDRDLHDIGIHRSMIYDVAIDRGDYRV